MVSCVDGFRECDGSSEPYLSSGQARRERRTAVPVAIHPQERRCPSRHAVLLISGRMDWSKLLFAGSSGLSGDTSFIKGKESFTMFFEHLESRRLFSASALAAPVLPA